VLTLALLNDIDSDDGDDEAQTRPEAAGKTSMHQSVLEFAAL